MSIHLQPLHLGEIHNTYCWYCTDLDLGVQFTISTLDLERSNGAVYHTAIKHYLLKLCMHIATLLPKVQP